MMKSQTHKKHDFINNNIHSFINSFIKPIKRKMTQIYGVSKRTKYWVHIDILLNVPNIVTPSDE